MDLRGQIKKLASNKKSDSTNCLQDTWMHGLSEVVRFLKCWKNCDLELNKTLLLSTNSGFYGTDGFGERAERQ